MEATPIRCYNIQLNFPEILVLANHVQHCYQSVNISHKLSLNTETVIQSPNKPNMTKLNDYFEILDHHQSQDRIVVNARNFRLRLSEIVCQLAEQENNIEVQAA